jgi:hypothetical protein
MATGELAQADSGRGAHAAPEPDHDEHPGQLGVPEDLPRGSVVTASGRVSGVSESDVHTEPETPFSPVQLSRLDEALTLVSRHTQLRFSIYLGDLGEDSHAGAQRLHEQLGAVGTDSVLIAVDPQRRNVDIVTGPEARVRLADRSAKLAVMSMVASFKEGDLVGGLLSGLRMLSDQAGEPQHSH